MLGEPPGGASGTHCKLDKDGVAQVLPVTSLKSSFASDYEEEMSILNFG